MEDFNLDKDSYIKKIIEEVKNESLNKVEDIEKIKKNLMNDIISKSENLYYSKWEMERNSYEEYLKERVLSIIDEIRFFGVNQGMEMGLTFGIEKTQKDIIERLIKKDFNKYAILDILNIDEEHYKELTRKI